jgi:proline dehydrogenase
MLRNVFIRLSTVPKAQPMLSRIPVANALVRRFIAGDSVEEALEVAEGLNGAGLNVSLDFLGESVTTMAEAAGAAETYQRVLERIGATGVRANVSIKLTQFGLDLDPEGCRLLVRRVAAAAADAGAFVRVDMEGTPHTDRTIELVREVHATGAPVGTVLQAYLYRTEDDLNALAGAGVKIRLCKGAYQEPADKAFPQKADVDANYVRLTHILLDHARDAAPASADGRTPPLAALATHDERMIAAATDYVARRKLPRDRFEFQMLYGVRRELQERLAREGFAVRTYVPFGTHWYPYFMRRLAERPANVWFIVSNLFKK